MGDNGGGLWSRILAVPVLALFLGVAILAGRMAYDWSPTLSEQVVGGVLTACGGGIALFGVAAGAIVGLAFYRRYTHSPGREDDFYYRGRPRQIPGAWPSGAGNGSYYLPPPRMEEPPVVEAPQGSWSSPGPAVYRHPADIDYSQDDLGPVQWQ